MEYHYPRVYAAIDLSAIEHNFRQIQAHIAPQTRIIPVVKMDGYGHGAAEIAHLLEKEDTVWGFAVATVEEACGLIRCGIQKPMLVLGAVFPEQWKTLLDFNIRATVFEEETALGLSRLAQERHVEYPLHLKVDTGMNRIGIRADRNAAEKIRKIAAMPGLKIEGLYTHFARADEQNKQAAHAQAIRFFNVRRQIEEGGIQIPLVHCANSAAIMDLPQYHCDAVRAGIILYGLMPSDQMQAGDFSLKPALSLKSRITFVKELLPGDEVSYGGTFTAKTPMRLATVPVGYGDGYPRSLSNKGYVLIDGKKAAVCGRICMDQFMVDVSDIPSARPGGVVTLIGPDGGKEVTVGELSALCGRFHYEFLCGLGKRIPRVFYYNGEAVSSQDYF